MKILNEGFIHQTAHDYDMDYEMVERVYLKATDYNNFYELLEEIVTEWLRK